MTAPDQISGNRLVPPERRHARGLDGASYPVVHPRRPRSVDGVASGLLRMVHEGAAEHLVGKLCRCAGTVGSPAAHESSVPAWLNATDGGGHAAGGDVDLGVTTRAVPGGLMVEVSGEVDLHSAPSLREALDAAVNEVTSSTATTTALLVDLSGVTFMDSTGLGELVGAHKALDRKGGRLHLTAGPDRIARLISLTGLDRVLAVHPDRSSAMASLAAQA